MDVSGANDALTLIARVTALGKRATHIQYEEALMAARQEILKYKEENLTLREAALERSEQLKLISVKGNAWLVDPSDLDGPHYCKSCYTAENRVVPLDGSFCRICKAMYED